LIDFYLYAVFLLDYPLNFLYKGIYNLVLGFTALLLLFAVQFRRSRFGFSLYFLGTAPVDELQMRFGKHWGWWSESQEQDDEKAEVAAEVALYVHNFMLMPCHGISKQIRAQL